MSDEQENALQAALSTAFSSTDIPLAVPETPSSGPSPTESFATAEGEGEDTPAAPQDAADEWKAEQERHLERWQHENALQREKAERTRREWEERRAQGEVVPETDEFLGAHLARVQNKADVGWEKVESESVPGQIVQSPSPIDARDMVTGEGDAQLLHSVLPVDKGPSPSASTSTIQPDPEQIPERVHTRSPTGSEKWDSFPASMASSYPSLSFPSSSPRTKSASEPHHGHEHSHDHHDHTHERPKPPASLSVFDSSLSTKTRVIALLGSLTINLVLPFVNGVMLGFGEIFSENVLFKYFGWKKSLGRTSIPGNVGLRK